MSDATYSINILDTGDHYMIAFENDIFNKGIIKRAISLYGDMDIAIELTKLGISVKSEMKEFIRSMCGRVIPYMSQRIIIQEGTQGDVVEGKQAVGDIMAKLKVDIVKIIDFHKVKRFWANYSNYNFKLDEIAQTVQVDEKPTNTDDICEGYNISSYCNQGNLESAFTDCILPKGIDFSKTVSSRSLVLNDRIQIQKKEVSFNQEAKSYILFNTIYNIAMFLQNAEGIEEMCEEFPEFEIAETFHPCVDPTINSNCGTFFHKKTFATKKELLEKVSAYKNLYGLNATDKDHESEKDKVFRYMKNMYDISTDPSCKIGASELYKMVINQLCIPYQERPIFKKRLSGYFIEMGLTRKRFSDGYFYYGIKVKYGDKIKGISIEEIMKKRQEEKKEWIPPSFGTNYPSQKSNILV